MLYSILFIIIIYFVWDFLCFFNLFRKKLSYAFLCLLKLLLWFLFLSFLVNKFLKSKKLLGFIDMWQNWQIFIYLIDRGFYTTFCTLARFYINNLPQPIYWCIINGFSKVKSKIESTMIRSTHHHYKFISLVLNFWNS